MYHLEMRLFQCKTYKLYPFFTDDCFDLVCYQFTQSVSLLISSLKPFIRPCEGVLPIQFISSLLWSLICG